MHRLSFQGHGVKVRVTTRSDILQRVTDVGGDPRPRVPVAGLIKRRRIVSIQAPRTANKFQRVLVVFENNTETAIELSDTIKLFCSTQSENNLPPP